MSLPSIYQNNNVIESNNQIEYTFNNETKIDLNTKINNLIKLKKILKITTNNNTYNAFIIGKTNRYLITSDSKLIEIKNIIDIE